MTNRAKYVVDAMLTRSDGEVHFNLVRRVGSEVPAGVFALSVVTVVAGDADAREKLKPGAEFYIDFTPA